MAGRAVVPSRRTVGVVSDRRLWRTPTPQPHHARRGARILRAQCLTPSESQPMGCWPRVPERLAAATATSTFGTREPCERLRCVTAALCGSRRRAIPAPAFGGEVGVNPTEIETFWNRRARCSVLVSFSCVAAQRVLSCRLLRLCTGQNNERTDARARQDGARPRVSLEGGVTMDRRTDRSLFIGASHSALCVQRR